MVSFFFIYLFFFFNLFVYFNVFSNFIGFFLIPLSVVHMDSPVHLLNWLAPQDSVVYKHNTWSARLFLFTFLLFCLFPFSYNTYEFTPSVFPPKEMLELTRSRIFELIGVNKKKEAVKVVYVKREEKEGGSRFIKGQDLEGSQFPPLFFFFFFFFKQRKQKK